MNGEIDSFIKQCLLDLLGEKAFAAEFGKGPIRNVAAGANDRKLDSAGFGKCRMGVDQPRLDFPGLNQRQGAAPGADDEPGRIGPRL